MKSALGYQCADPVMTRFIESRPGRENEGI